MCRNIKPLFNYDPPANDEEIRDASLQYVRKVSGYTNPSRVNEQEFMLAVDEVSQATRKLLDSLSTTAKPRDRAAEAARMRAHAVKRFDV
jgi:hypothetical protein